MIMHRLHKITEEEAWIQFEAYAKSCTDSINTIPCTNARRAFKDWEIIEAWERAIEEVEDDEDEAEELLPLFGHMYWTLPRISFGNYLNRKQLCQ